MAIRKLKIALLLNHIPLIGILSFTVLYVYSTNLYPGGSSANLISPGFDWVLNYWCNLMNTKAIYGVINHAGPYAIASLIILCGSLVVFFYQFAEYATENNFWKKAIKFTGTLSMLFGVLIFTKYHDLMTIISSLFGIFVVIGIIITIYRSDMQFYKITASLCIVILAINNLIYYSGYFLEWLPLIQKISFLVILIWVLGLNGVVRQRIKKQFE